MTTVYDTPNPSAVKLTDRYRPQKLSQVWGQSYTINQLDLWLNNPSSSAFIFAGGTGTGKTSTAIALASALGVNVDQAEFGGLHQISSGEQNGESVRAAMKTIAFRPMMGSGWRMLIVNEADMMTPNAATVWLDALESLPAKVVVVFTTNSVHKFQHRLRDRCEVFEFVSSALFLRPELEHFARQVWFNETGADDCPDIDSFGSLIDEKSEVSFRRLLQLMEPFVRSKKSGSPLAPRIRKPAASISPAKPINPMSPARKAWITRRANLLITQGA